MTRFDAATVALLAFIACLLGVALGMVFGQRDVLSVVCRAECGDYWTTDGYRCVCLVVSP